jgi:hypothetical protein
MSGLLNENKARQRGQEDPEWAGYMLGKTLLRRLGRPAKGERRFVPGPPMIVRTWRALTSSSMAE